MTYFKKLKQFQHNSFYPLSLSLFLSLMFIECDQNSIWISPVGVRGGGGEAVEHVTHFIPFGS